MAELSPKLLKRCRTEFQKQYAESKKVLKIISRIRDGTATLKDASDYSKIIGEMLGTVLASVLTPEALPEEKLFWNIAQDVIKPLIHDNHELVTVCSVECQKLAYKQANVGLMVATPKRNDERIKGLLDDVCAEGIDAEQLSYRLSADTKNITESFFADFVEENAERASSVGLKTKVVRAVSSGGCCKWCDSLAGIYDYDEVKARGHDIWLRHVNCDCDITYITEKYAEKVNNYRRMKPKSR